MTASNPDDFFVGVIMLSVESNQMLALHNSITCPCHEADNFDELDERKHARKNIVMGLDKSFTNWFPR